MTEQTTEQESPLITEEMIGKDARAEGLQKEYQRKFKVQWRTVQDALNQGYIYPGWNLYHYLKATDKGNPNLGLHCECGKMFWEHEDFSSHKSAAGHQGNVRKPFEYVNIWGVQGASKSSFALQLLAKLYGDWHIAVERMLLEQQMLIDAYEEVPLPDQRIPGGCLDDLNTIISKQEWFIDKEFYILFHKFLNTVRTKFGTLLSTLPNIEFTPEMLGDIVTFEVIVYPNSSYKVERYCWDIDPFRPVVARFSKIVVEQARFDIYKTPPGIWQLYQNKRLEVANKLFIRMKEYMERGGKKSKEASEAVRKVLKSATIDDTIRELRAKGVKGSNDELRRFINIHRDVLEKSIDKKDAKDAQ